MIEIKENLNLSNSRPGNDKYNRQIFAKYKEHFSNISEFIYFYKNKLKEKPRCKICGKQLKFSLVTYKYPIYCSIHCRSKDKDNLDKQEQTCLKRYGVKNIFEDKQKIKQAIKNKYNVENVAKLEWVKEKKKETCKKQYGVESYTKTQECKDKIKKTCLKHFGKISNLATEEHKEKLKQYNINKYGVDNIFKSAEFKQYLKEHHNEIQQKMYYTKKQNGTFNSSNEEKEIYVELLKKFNEKDILQQYKSEKYPFACDFYIKPLDLYIEYNGSWTHGKDGDTILGMFNPNEPTHIAILDKWKAKGSKYYYNAIDTWTKRDIKKLKYFNNNKLNYKIFYTKEQFYNWYNAI